MSPPAALMPPHEMAPASADSCLKTPTGPRENRNATFFFFPLFPANLLFFSLHIQPLGTSREPSAKPKPDGELSPSWNGLSPPLSEPPRGVGTWGCGLQPLHTVNKCADSAAIATILSFQNFLPPLPKYKRTFCAEQGAGAMTGSAQGAMWYLVSLQYMFL